MKALHAHSNIKHKKRSPLRMLYQQTGGKSHITKTQSFFYLHLLWRELEEYVERRSFIC